MSRALSDEEIMAYADGELPAPERKVVQRAWACDPEVRHLVHVFRRTQLLAGEAYADLGDDAATRRLAADILQVPRQSARVGDRIKPQRFPSETAMAAMAVATLIIGVAGLTGRTTDQVEASHIEVGEVATGSTLARHLDAAVAGETSDGRERRLVIAERLTDKLGNACFEIDAFGEEQFSIPDTVFVACRNAKLSWSVIAALRTMPFKSAGARAYVIEARDAHAALAGVLETIGLKQRTTEIKDENPTR